MNPVFGSSEKNAYCKLTFLTLKVHAQTKISYPEFKGRKGFKNQFTICNT